MSKEATRPEYKVTQVGVFAGHDFPEKFLEAVFLNRSSTVGFAVVDASEGKPEMSLVQASSSELPDWLASVKEARAGFKDKDMLFAFGDYPKTFADPKDIQPYPLVVNENGKPLVVAAIEGIKPNAANTKDNGQSDALNLVEGYLGPKFADQYAKAGKDPEKFEGLINTDQFRGELSWLNATMTIMTLRGKLIHISDPENKQGKDFEWGYTTDSFEYTEGALLDKKEETAAATPAKPQTLMERMKAGQAVNAAGKPAPAIVTAAAPAKSYPEGGTPVVPDLTKFKRGDKLPEGYEWASPPLGKDNKNKREWYVAHDVSQKGFVPPDYKNSPAIPVRSANTKLKTELEKTTSNKTPAAKDVTAHNLPTIPPFMTFEAKQRFDKFMKKGRSSAVVDKDSKAIMNPEYIKTLEDDAPSFASETGIPWRAIYNWDRKAIKEFAGDRTEVELMLVDLRNFALKSEQVAFQGRPPTTENVKTETPAKKPSGLLARVAAGR